MFDWPPLGYGTTRTHERLVARMLSDKVQAGLLPVVGGPNDVEVVSCRAENLAPGRGAPAADRGGAEIQCAWPRYRSRGQARSQ